MVMRVGTDNAQPQMDLSDMWLHDHAQEQEDNSSPSQNDQNSPNCESSEIPQGLSDSASMEPFSSFTSQLAILRADMDNAQPQMDLSHVRPHVCAEEQEEDFSPPYFNVTWSK